MSEVYGSTPRVVAQVPDQGARRPSGPVGELSDLHVGHAQEGQHEKLDFKQTADARRSIRGDLEFLFGKSRDKAHDIAMELDMDSMGGGIARSLRERLGGDPDKGLPALSDKDTNKLKSQLHYSRVTTFFSSSTPEDRLKVRAAVLSAFAQGASLEETGTLRKLLDSANPQTKQQVLDALNAPGANVHTIIANLQRA